MSEGSLREKLCGVWTLERFIDIRDGNEVVHSMGENATGYISYSPDGWISVQIMSAEREQFDNADIIGGTTEQLAKASTSYFAYAGTYVTDEAEQTVTHHLDFCLIPNWVNTAQLRHVELSENNTLLTLSADPMVFDGVTHNPELRWRRRVND